MRSSSGDLCKKTLAMQRSTQESLHLCTDVMMCADMRLRVGCSEQQQLKRGKHSAGSFSTCHNDAPAHTPFCCRSNALERAAGSVEATADWLKRYHFLSKVDMQTYSNMVGVYCEIRSSSGEQRSAFCTLECRST